MLNTEITIEIGGKRVGFRRLLLRGWAKLEEVKTAMDDAITNKDFASYFTSSVQFVEMALSKPTKTDWNALPWYEFLNVYSSVVSLNLPSIEFPLLISNKKKEEKKLPWEYTGRAWFFWLNLFAHNYGWSEEVIENMDIDSALGLYQELLMDEQFEREWQWGLSEIAFPYNSATKKQEYKPLQRPEWMLPLAPTQLPVIKIRKDMMPMGNIVDLSVKPVAKQEGMRGI